VPLSLNVFGAWNVTEKKLGWKKSADVQFDRLKSSVYNSVIKFLLNLEEEKLGEPNSGQKVLDTWRSISKLESNTSVDGGVCCTPDRIQDELRSNSSCVP
jgi:hypothetical protein